MKLKTTLVEIVSRQDGSKVQGEVFSCPACNGDSFYVYKVHDHLHLQCFICEQTYCQREGECAPVPQPTYEIGPGWIKCLRCGLTSYNLNDIKNLWCGKCGAHPNPTKGN